MIGGFLGAGKTTTIASLANRFRSEGKNVAIVTNDQASDLVDALLLRSLGFSVCEVAERLTQWREDAKKNVRARFGVSCFYSSLYISILNLTLATLRLRALALSF